MSRSYTYLILWEGVTTSKLHDSIYRDEKCEMQLQTRKNRELLNSFIQVLLGHPDKRI
jgi:hypothetical protein